MPAGVAALSHCGGTLKGNFVVVQHGSQSTKNGHFVTMVLNGLNKQNLNGTDLPRFKKAVTGNSLRYLVFDFTNKVN